MTVHLDKCTKKQGRHIYLTVAHRGCGYEYIPDRNVNNCYGVYHIEIMQGEN